MSKSPKPNTSSLGWGLATNLIELAGADVNLWGILVGEVPKKEKVAFVMISVTGPTLLEGDTIEIGINHPAADKNLITYIYNCLTNQ